MELLKARRHRWVSACKMLASRMAQTLEALGRQNNCLQSVRQASFSRLHTAGAAVPAGVDVQNDQRAWKHQISRTWVSDSSRK